ncbi:MAG: hypothetical protein GY952_14015 [Rhodobacteraceae bacterium]|nr:hypothetical protein [Paracoccaceae bacterium]
MAETEVIKFMAGGGDLSEDPKLALLATCIINQQRAGFKNVVDLREELCPDCNAPGFNTGWGFLRFTCGAEILSCGEEAEPCGERHP